MPELPKQPLVSHTYRMLQAEMLAEQFTQHLASLPVTDVEQAYIQEQAKVLLDTLRAEITDWQRLACTSAAQSMRIVRSTVPLSVKEQLDIGIIGGQIVARATDTLTNRQFTREEYLGLSAHWPQLRVNVQIEGGAITITTKPQDEPG